MKAQLALSLSLILIASARAQVQVLPPDFTLFGKTSGEYLVELHQYLDPLTTNGDYLFPKAVPSSTDPVYFLQRPYFGVAPPVGIQNYFIPDDVYVYVPIVHFAFDNIDSAVILTPAQLRDEVNSVVDTITGLRAIIDGVALTNLFDYRTESPVFSIFYPTNDNFVSEVLGHPYEGLDDPVVGAGYLLMLAPLPVGLHDFRTAFAVGGVNNFKVERHYQINVFHRNHVPVADLGATVTRVISPNNRDAEVVLDGSRSSDPDNDPLTYSWLEGEAVIGAGIRATNLVAVGSHAISLVVSDGQLNATNTVTVEVITPCEALAALASPLEEAQLPRKKLRPLLEELREACAAFEHGFRSRHHDRQEQLQHAIGELQEFQHEVREELGRANPDLAARLIQGAQEIIDAAKPARAHYHGEKDEDEDDHD